MPCIYKFENKLNGKIYIGQTINIKRRHRDHKRSNSKFGAFPKAVKKYGIDGFYFEILESCEIIKLSSRELFWIEFYGSMAPNGYNLIKGDIHGERSGETKAKNSASMINRYKDEDYRKTMLDRVISMGKDPDVQNKKRISMKSFHKTTKGINQAKEFGIKMKKLNKGCGTLKLAELCKDPEFIKMRSQKRRSKVIYKIKNIESGDQLSSTIYHITTELNLMSRVDFSSIKSGKQKTAKGWAYIGEEK